jgi:hypothetical protein
MNIMPSRPIRSMFGVWYPIMRISADIREANVVVPNNEDVWFASRGSRRLLGLRDLGAIDGIDCRDGRERRAREQNVAAA